MSRATIGGVVGAVIGFVASGYNPQGAYWGWVIGSGVGALTDNTKTYGPRLQDASQQTSQDGTPRTYGYGTFPTTGVILWRDERYEHEEEQGKGGPSNVSYTYTWSYAIGVCLGPINNYLIIKRNGTIVYDTRSSAELTEAGYTADQITKTRMAQSKWAQYSRLYFGTDDQMPDPTMQAVEGVNNAPAYRGYAYIVLTNEDVTSDGGAIPQYEFVVSQCGTSSVSDLYEGQLLITGSPKTTGGPMYATAAANMAPRFFGIPQSIGADLSGVPQCYDGLFGVAGSEGLRSAPGSLNVFSTPTHPWTIGYEINDYVSGPDGWLVTNMTLSHYDDLQYGGDPTLGFIDITTGFTDHMRFAGGYWWWSWAGALRKRARLIDEWELVSSGQPIDVWIDIVEHDDHLYATCKYGSEGFEVYTIRRSEDNGATWSTVLVEVTDDTHIPFHLCSDGLHLLAYCLGGGVWTTANTWSEWVDTGLDGAGPPDWIPGGAASVYMDGGRYITTASGLFFVVWDDLMVISMDGGLVWVPAPEPMPISAARGIAGYSREPTSHSTPVPDAPGSYVDRDGTVIAPGGTQTERCKPLLSGIVTHQAAKRNVTRIVTTELATTEVDGFRVAIQTNPAANIRALQSAYMFDASDIDGRLHFLMRPQPLTFHLTMDDLTETAGDPYEWEITKENDLLRKVTINYFDPRTNYSQTAQDWERRSATIEANGEGTFEVALTGTGDWGKRLAEKSGKIAWAEARETKLPVTIAHAARYTGEWGTFTDKAGTRHVIRITKIEDQGLRRVLHVRKTRKAAYESTAVGVRSPLPSFPNGNVRGPNVSVLMNMPVMRVEDDRSGLYWAVTGLLDTWRGSTLALARDGSTFETGPSVTQPATIGWLTATLPAASRYGMDVVNTLSVELHPGSTTTLESTDYAGIQDERNVIAVVYPSGKVELMQFMTATPLGGRRYDLTNLTRGRKDTVAGEHLADAKFVLMDNRVRFVGIRADDVGKTLTFRSTSDGTDPDAAQTTTMLMDTIESLREWQPYNINVVWSSGGGCCIDWIGRGRLGTDRVPVDSQYFDGYTVTFTVGSVTHVVNTYEQSICVSYAELLLAFGADFGVPQIAVRARSKVATDDDDFDSIPGAPADPDANYPAVIVGDAGDMYGYVGEPVFDALGPNSGSPFQAYGGMWQEGFLGEIVGNVTARSDRPGEGAVQGVPLVAETRAAALELVPSGPLVVGGPFLITDSVTILPKPTYGMMDETLLSRGNPLATAVTTPPRATKIVPASGYGHIRSRAGFNSGLRRCVLTIANLPVGGSIAVGVHAGSRNSSLSPGLAGHLAFEVTANGAYAIETDGATGATTIKLVGGGTLATGTLPLTYSYDGKYRFAWNVLNAAPGATVHANQGNEAWPDTPTGGYGGVPNVPMIVPCGFDIAVATANSSRLSGELSMTAVAAPTAEIANYAYAVFGRSTGKHRIAMANGDANARIGFCQTGHTGRLGANGTGDSIGFTDTRSSDGYIIETSFGSTHKRIVIPSFFYYSNPLVRFAFDVDAGTLEIWVKVEVTTGDPSAVYELLATLENIPAGTWLPAISGSGQWAPEIDDPATYDDWTEIL